MEEIGGPNGQRPKQRNGMEWIPGPGMEWNGMDWTGTNGTEAVMMLCDPRILWLFRYVEQRACAHHRSRFTV